MAKACQLFSGSSGNSIYISNKKHHFLVDIGVTAKKCEEGLRAIGVEPSLIEAIFVTHEHIDHCKGIRVFATRYDIPVYATKSCIDEMLKAGNINEKVKTIEIGKHLVIDDVDIQTFELSHDSEDCIGYRFNLFDGRSISICTDTGYVTDEAKRVLAGTSLIFLESNHEISMLMNGPYNYNLKKRILSENGHLSNFACGEYMKELAQSGTFRFVLSHLSRENNTPELAYQNAISALDEIDYVEGVDYKLYVSPKENMGNGITI